ncbi:MAG: AAA family ATPase [Pseudomonadales bacterium]|nr:AAA family ATPase [Pseudomonadales bacterium]
MIILVISGAVGVGKSTVGKELSRLLRKNDVPHSFIDLDSLSATYPRPASDRFGKKLGLKNLATIIPNIMEYGTKNIVLSGVIADREDLVFLSSLKGIKSVKVCQLYASLDVLRLRISNRDEGEVFDWCFERAKVLSKSLRDSPKDFSLNTDQLSPPEIASELLLKVSWV